MNNFRTISFTLIFLLAACTLPSAAPTDTPVLAATTAAPSTARPTDTPAPTLAPPTETLTSTPIPPTSTPTAVPFVESLDATVTGGFLTCRYGPGAEYLSLFAFNEGANIQIIGRTGGNNWVLVENEPQRCWVNTKYLDIKGDKDSLKVMYPDGFKLIVSPYYSPTTVLSAVRDANNKNKVTVKWADITLRAGDEEDANMFIYIVEVWRCEGGKMIFDPLASNYPEVTFVDEAGCSVPSHGRVFFQEKHGFAGPAEIPWPAQ